MTLKTELMTFAIKPGKEARADAWMQMLIDRRAECIATLDREKMHHECIFRSVRNGRVFLSWLSVQSEQAPHVRGSPHAIDQAHLAFWDECIDRDVPPEMFEHVVSFVPPEVERVILQRDAA